MEIDFDADKASSNRAKHGISFDEAATALLDSSAIVIEDPDAIGENRWVLTGMSALFRHLTVVYTYRCNTLRLISARKATAKEVRVYEKGI